MTGAEQRYIRAVDVDYAKDVAVRLAAFRTNEKLGYRTSGSLAEHEAGAMLQEEMRRIGLKSVVSEPITIDAWTFEKAELSYADSEGGARMAVLGAYAVDLDTGGPKDFQLVYAGRGTQAELAALDVHGKLVLIDIDQRADWWITYPAYEAHLRGAAAVLVAQTGGFAEVSPNALNANDICGPAYAPALSVSRADADALHAALQSSGGALAVTLDAKSTVARDGTAYNITGVIPGRRGEAMVLMTAHYDAYFEGFQDNSISVGLMLSIARSLAASGYKPEKTLVFCATAAEEWGVTDTHYDWCAGAFAHITRVHPEWAGKTAANINLELPGYDRGYRCAEIRASYELRRFVETLGETVPPARGRFPGGVAVVIPTQTWSDDFSFAIAGIPATVNKLHDDFGFSVYHTQMDDASTCDEASVRYYAALFGLLMMAYDRCAVPPLDFSERFAALNRSVDAEIFAATGLDVAPLLAATGDATRAGERLYRRIDLINNAYATAVREGNGAEADRLLAESTTLFARVLEIFKRAEDELTRLSWQDVSVFPHEMAQSNLAALRCAIDALEEGRAADAVNEHLRYIDNNMYALRFSRETYDYFTGRVMNQSADRLQWGAGRVEGHEDLYDIIHSLLQKAERGETCFTREIADLTARCDRQAERLGDAARRVSEVVCLLRMELYALAGDVSAP